MIDKARWTYNVSYMGRHSKTTCAFLIRRLNVELKGIFITSQSLDHEHICLYSGICFALVLIGISLPCLLLSCSMSQKLKSVSNLSGMIRVYKANTSYIASTAYILVSYLIDCFFFLINLAIFL